MEEGIIMDRKSVFRKNPTNFYVGRAFSARFMLVLCFIFVLCAEKPPAADAGVFNRNDTHVALYHFTHASLVNGKADYFPYAPGSAAPKYDCIVIEPFNIWRGEIDNVITLSSYDITIVTYYDDGSDKYFQRMIVGKDNKFGIFSRDDSHYISDANGKEVEFRDGAETNFSHQPFRLYIDGYGIGGVFPHIKTTREQMFGRCVPYIELITDGELAIGFWWRFVDPTMPGFALVRSPASDVSAIYGTRLRVSGEFVNVDYSRTFESLDTLEGVIIFEKSYETAEIHNIRLSFEFADGFADNAYIRYFWTFFKSLSTR